MNLCDALKLVEPNDCIKTSQLECLITRQQIEHEIKLKCGHSFEYIALFRNLKATQSTYNHHSCPYCRTSFKNFIPFYEKCFDHSLGKKTIFFRKNDYLTCSHTFVSGKRKGQTCEKYANLYKVGCYCPIHFKKQTNAKTQTNPSFQCSEMLKIGRRCRNKTQDGKTKLCKIHCSSKKNPIV